MTTKIKVGLIGYGKTGKAVANVLSSDSRFELCWIARRQSSESQKHVDTNIPIIGMTHHTFEALLDDTPVEAIIDFSAPQVIHLYGDAIRQRGITLITAISSYAQYDLKYIHSLGEYIRVMSSPNITLGINFLIMAANLLRKIAPFADVEILEQHFKGKPEISGTALKIAETLGLSHKQVTSLRLGGVIGEHEVIFGFPHQTVRLSHSSIRREAFGTGAAFALTHLIKCKPGFYTYEELLMNLAYEELKIHDKN